ncbi:hypothetical protein [Paractinoplanes toevensis]|uniref:Uncharacterized protein n=1 Tax=Paractinoplanes toevensis TaxID=571911 RepID=A0A919T4V3_9ACTN|nr:hypothetical protein [Actinoplanes toevensis]GIM88407.1 hypothetical protein Ato02nite_002000 [Actinoplanes toevensis]
MIPEGDHRDVEAAFRAAGWTPCGAGDWAIALRSPDGTRAARISPFMADIPLASTGPWPPGEQEALRAALASAQRDADAR